MNFMESPEKIFRYINMKFLTWVLHVYFSMTGALTFLIMLHVLHKLHVPVTAFKVRLILIVQPMLLLGIQLSCGSTG